MPTYRGAPLPPHLAHSTRHFGSSDEDLQSEDGAVDARWGTMGDEKISMVWGRSTEATLPLTTLASFSGRTI